MNNQKEILNNINFLELNDFVNNTSSKFNGNINTEKRLYDYSWVDLIDESIPYLENIVRDPRRFIVQEELLTPIEKTKLISKETVKHLATHTELIKSVDEDDSVNPTKLLNIYREETYDIYENRFVKTLIDRLYLFLCSRIDEDNQEMCIITKKTANYDAETSLNDEKVNINLEIYSYKKEDINNLRELKKKIEKAKHLRSLVDALKSTDFYKSLKNCIEVKSPIRKTNVILKDINFQKITKLWEFLESQIDEPNLEIENKNVPIDVSNKSYFDLAFYLDKCGMKSTKFEGHTFDKMAFSRLLKEAVFEANLSSKKIGRIINVELEKVLKQRDAEIRKVKKYYQDQIDLFTVQRNKAFKYLR